MTYSIGVDIGGTKIAAGLVDPYGRIVAQDRAESPASDPAQIVETVVGLVTRLGADHEVGGVGVAAAGLVTADRSTVRFAPNLAWRDEPLRERLEEHLDHRIVVENDANAAAWGEFVHGAGKDVENLLLVTVGTGVGGGVVIDGELLRGGFGYAAEIGHLRVVPQGQFCGCGNRGCLEAYASGSALVRSAQAQAQTDPDLAASVLERAGGDPHAIDGPMITEAAQAGDAFAVQQLAELGRWLGEGIASLAAILDPQVVILGGGVCAAGDLLLDPVRTAFGSELTGRGHREVLEFRLAQLGNDAGLIGAADLAIDRRAEPTS